MGTWIMGAAVVLLSYWTPHPQGSQSHCDNVHCTALPSLHNSYCSQMDMSAQICNYSFVVRTHIVHSLAGVSPALPAWKNLKHTPPPTGSLLLLRQWRAVYSGHRPKLWQPGCASHRAAAVALALPGAASTSTHSASSATLGCPFAGLQIPCPHWDWAGTDGPSNAQWLS